MQISELMRTGLYGIELPDTSQLVQLCETVRFSDYALAFGHESAGYLIYAEPTLTDLFINFGCMVVDIRSVHQLPFGSTRNAFHYEAEASARLPFVGVHARIPVPSHEQHDGLVAWITSLKDNRFYALVTSRRFCHLVFVAGTTTDMVAACMEDIGVTNFSLAYLDTVRLLYPPLTHLRAGR